MRVVVGMHKLSDILFVSSNIHKFKEAKEILDSIGIPIKFFKLTLEEIQSKSIKEIALKKAKDAYSKCCLLYTSDAADE